MAGRNSYSKTDPDATFMRMKEDHMKNGQLKPAYNLQASTENNYITTYTVHQSAGDSTTLKEHYTEMEQQLGELPSIAVADAGYGSEENYQYLEDHQVENLVKYAGFHKEQKSKKKSSDLSVSSLYYHQQGNYMICPMGQKMDFVGTKENKTTTGFIQTLHVFRARKCYDCPLHSKCFKSKDKYKKREVTLNLNALRHRKKARENLLSKDGAILRKQRCAEVEQMFGQMKANKKFTRFLMRGIDKVSVELGLLFSAMNISKYVKKRLKDIEKQLNNNISSLLPKIKLVKT